MTDRDTAPIGYARYSNEFFRAALMIDDKMGNEEGYETHAPVPVMYMIGHSIELSLKSYLLHTGTKEDQLRNEYGHDLIKAFDAANNAGLSKLIDYEDIELEVLSFLNKLYQSKQLNYISVGPKQFPVFGPLQSLGEKILTSVSNEVGWRYVQ